MSVLYRASKRTAVLLIGFLWASAPLHAADAPGTWVIRDYPSCLSFGDRFHGKSGETSTLEHNTSWDFAKKECTALYSGMPYFGLPREIPTNCASAPNGQFRCDLVWVATVEVAPDVTVVTRSGDSWGLRTEGRVINRGSIEITSEPTDLGTGTIENQGSMRFYAPSAVAGTLVNGGSMVFNAGAAWRQFGTLVNHGGIRFQGPDERVLTGTFHNAGGKVELYDGPVRNEGELQNDGEFDIGPGGPYGPKLVNTGRFLNQPNGRLEIDNIGVTMGFPPAIFQNHAVEGWWVFSYVQRGVFENLGTILNTGNFDLSKSPIHLIDGAFDSSHGTVIADSASAAAFIDDSQPKNGRVALKNVGMVDIRQEVVIGATGSLEIEAGTTLRVLSGAQLANFGAVLNRGDLQVAGGIVNKVGARISNYTRARIGQGGSFANDGIFDNPEGAALIIAGLFANAGALNNQGAIDISCPGTITNNPVDGNAPRVTPCAPVITSAVLADPRAGPATPGFG